MYPQVILTATHGDPEGREFAFDGPATCVIGRCVDCQVLALPEGAEVRPAACEGQPGDDAEAGEYLCVPGL